MFFTSPAICLGQSGASRKMAVFFFLNLLAIAIYDSIYLATVHSRSELIAMTAHGRPAMLYYLAMAVIIVSGLCMLSTALLTAGIYREWDLGCRAILWCSETFLMLGLIAGAALAVHTSRYGTPDWDASDYASQYSSSISAYLSSFPNNSVYVPLSGLFNRFPGEGVDWVNARADELCFSVLPLDTLTAMTLGDDQSFAVGSFTYYEEDITGSERRIFYGTALEYRYDEQFRASWTSACHTVFLDPESLRSALLKTDACLLKFAGDSAQCAPGWNLDRVRSNLFCEPFEICVEDVEAVLEAFGKGQPVQVDSSWFLEAGWDREKYVNDAYLAALARWFARKEVVSVHSYHMAHSFFLGLMFAAGFIDVMACTLRDHTFD
jgi:hypothetical protein